MKKLLVLMFGFSLIFAGCGGGGGDSNGGGNGGGPTIGTGKFLDSAVQGLSYVSGNQSGLTDANGTFTYEIGQPVTFSIGGVTIGQATGQEIVTPVNLVSGGNATNTTVQNITRFLMMLDSDDDLTNGITISQEVLNIAANWSNVDFTASDFASEVSSIIQGVSNAYNRTATLPDAATAESHLKGTVFCAYSGGFKGTFSGDFSGWWATIIDALTGNIIGMGYDNKWNEYFTAIGQLNVDATNSFAAGITDGTSTWQGTVTTDGMFSGTWEDKPYEESGTFTGNRVILSLPPGASGTIYTGTFSGTDVGIFSIAIDGNGNILGTGYSGTDDANFSITGTSVGNQIAIGNTSTGVSFTGTFATDGTFSGTWSGDGFGTFSGCTAI